MQLDAVLRIAEKDHLLPLDHAEVMVLDDADFDGQFVLHRRGKLGHQHAEPAVPDERHHLPLGICPLRRDSVRQSRRHAGERAGECVLLPALGGDMARPPRGDGAGIARHDRVVAQPLADRVCHHLRLHWLLIHGRELEHEFVPLLHALLGFLQKAAIGVLLEPR